MLHRWSVGFWVAGLCCLASVLEASFASTKAQGMGGTGVAHPQDALAGAYNPAGMVWVGDRTDLGAYWKMSDPHTLVVDSTLTNADGSFSGTRGQNFGLGEFGINYMFLDACDVSVGLVAYTRDWFKASYSSTFPAFGTGRLMYEYYAGAISPVGALRFEKFSFGVSADLVVQRMKLTGFQNFDNSLDSVRPNAVTNKKENFTLGVTYTLGALWKISPCFSLGVMWQIHGKAWEFEKYEGLIPQDGHMPLPDRVIGGCYWRPYEVFGVAFDVEHVSWNRPRWFHQTFSNSAADLESVPFGSVEGPGLGWNDQTIIRVGSDLHLAEFLIVRCGYSYGRTPIQKDQTFMNVLTCNVIEQVVSVGLTFRYLCSELSGYYSYGVKRTIHGKPISADFGGGTYTLSNQSQSAGLAFGWRW